MTRAYLLLSALALLAPPHATAQERTDTLTETVTMTDTLRTITVTDDSRLPIRVSDAAKERIATKSLTDIIGPTATDKMMHPLAVRQRRKERHRRKMARILRDYDLITTDRELLLQALRREGIDPDSIISSIPGKSK